MTRTALVTGAGGGIGSATVARLVADGVHVIATDLGERAAALPPEEPPGVCSADHGLRVCPNAGPLVNGHWPSSQVLVLPTITAPAARSRRTTSESASATRTWPPAPNRVGTPATSTSSLTAIGMPSNGNCEIS